MTFEIDPDDLPDFALWDRDKNEYKPVSEFPADIRIIAIRVG